MNRQEILDFLGDDWHQVCVLMQDALHSDINLLTSINGSLLSNSGKMLRPIISLLMARACSGTVSDDSMLFAAATELLHNATLLHDDVADESTERRGKPTLNALMGPQAAVLIGDFWLARAVQTVLKSTDGNRERVIQMFARTLADLAEGEMLQLQKASTSDTDETDYFRIIHCKTASLFEVACESAAVSVSAPEGYRQAALRYAGAAGIAFQIKDDILDYAGNEELGKPVGIDLLEQKITLPLLCAMHDSGREEEIRGMVASVHECPENCGKVRDFVYSRGGVELASARLDGYIEDAVHALDVLPDSAAKGYLIDLVRYNAFRRV